MNYTSIELFAGAGGSALGLELAGFQHLGLVENNTVCCDTLTKNRPSWNIFNQNIKEFTDYEIKVLFGNKELDLLSGGPPCQSFSYAGKKAGFVDPRGLLINDLLRFANVLRPKIVLIENVKGLSTHDNGISLKYILEELEKMSYTPYYSVLNSNNYEVAQKRERLFIVSINNKYKDLGEFVFPSPIIPKLVLKNVIHNEIYDDISSHPYMKYPESKKKILDLVPPGGSWINLPVDIQKSYLGKSYHSKGGKRGIARRLSWDEPSLTLTTSPMQKQTERCHPDETRPFNIKEYALIQSFPYDYIFEGSIYDIYRQIGNAVPVNLAKHMGISIKKYLDKIYNYV